MTYDGWQDEGCGGGARSLRLLNPRALNGVRRASALVVRGFVAGIDGRWP